MDGQLIPQTRRQGDGEALVFHLGEEAFVAVPQPAAIETVQRGALDPAGKRSARAYETVERTGGCFTGVAVISEGDAEFRLTDRWTSDDAECWRVERRLEVVRVGEIDGVRLILELAPALANSGYNDFRYFAPPALYDLNDLNDDGVEDYLETRSLHFREDRLNLLTLLAYSDCARAGLALSRADLPEVDPVPERRHGESAFLQATDIGSLGIEPAGDSVRLVAAYPFAERTRSHALLVKERAPFAAFYPVAAGTVLSAAYSLRVAIAGDVHAAVAAVWRQRLRELRPRPVALPLPIRDLTGLRLDALEHYYIEEKDGDRAAGFVTNCHPQDGRQLSNVIQFGFTGQNNLNAFNLLRAGSRENDDRRRAQALRVLDFFVRTAGRSPFGLIPGYYNADNRQFGSWWTGLILPLAYTKPGADLEKLMGPLYQLLRDVIEALRGREGVYLRCVAEEYDALLAAYRYEQQGGTDHAEWRQICQRFGSFLVDHQEADGSWFRAYDFAGKSITSPVNWFGQTEVQRKSSTATVVPFLLGLYELTAEGSLIGAAKRAGHFVQRHYVDRIRANGGIHDSIYAKPQLVDGESIIFAMRALRLLHRTTGEPRFLDGAVRAANLVVTWICLWDVPLPRQSTLARHGFRSTGWMACDAPGAGYIHPMGLLAVPELVEMAIATGDEAYFDAAELLHAGCNETVAVPGKDWGYAMPGLQEEGLLISWWFADDPMFAETGFGGRGKGEGNKTCLPWISAVSVDAYEELLARHGTADIAAIRQRMRRVA